MVGLVEVVEDRHTQVLEMLEIKDTEMEATDY